MSSTIKIINALLKAALWQLVKSECNHGLVVHEPRLHVWNLQKENSKGFFPLLLIKCLPLINSTYWPIPPLFTPLLSKFHHLLSILLPSIDFQPRSPIPRAYSKFLHPSLFFFKVFAFFPSLILDSKMGYSHLLNTKASLTNFRATYGFP